METIDLIKYESLGDALTLSQNTSTYANAQAIRAEAIADNTKHIGDYNADYVYSVNNLVQWDSGIYICIQEADGIEPSNTSYWTLIYSFKELITNTNTEYLNAKEIADGSE